ncbi:Hypothetical_protein [Hexamita inflata]|uniref:Hypothetical_protein n=1 Tax=Hexamita inflata TaxID=28002 RepID=A0AA86QNN8_9EUKA|nr:Hypothetical protein HINF_LOCUS47652 [Hexamita inflata]
MQYDVLYNLQIIYLSSAILLEDLFQVLAVIDQISIAPLQKQLCGVFIYYIFLKNIIIYITLQYKTINYRPNLIVILCYHDDNGQSTLESWTIKTFNPPELRVQVVLSLQKVEITYVLSRNRLLFIRWVASETGTMAKTLCAVEFTILFIYSIYANETKYFNAGTQDTSIIRKKKHWQNFQCNKAQRSKPRQTHQLNHLRQSRIQITPIQIKELSIFKNLSMQTLSTTATLLFLVNQTTKYQRERSRKEILKSINYTDVGFLNQSLSPKSKEAPQAPLQQNTQLNQSQIPFVESKQTCVTTSYLSKMFSRTQVSELDIIIEADVVQVANQQDQIQLSGYLKDVFLTHTHQPNLMLDSHKKIGSQEVQNTEDLVNRYLYWADRE